MKKVIIIISLSVYNIGFLFSQTATPPAVGDGSIGNPYQISILENLYWIRTNSSEWNKYFIQTADIDASSTQTWFSNQGWLRIGHETTQFTGSYDGQNYTISNLYINRPTTDHVGLFGFVNGVSIQNLSLINVDITGNNHTGGLVGEISGGTISNCHTTGTVSGQGAVGGLVGYSTAYSAVSHCYSTATVNATGYPSGGLVAENRLGCTIDNSYSAGSVTSTNKNVGGLVGSNLGGTISNCYSRTSVNGNTTVGGLVGFENDAAVTNCYSTGSVSGSSAVRGFIGNSGVSGHTVTDCFWDTQTSGQSISVGGTGKTTTEMKDLDTFTDESTVGLSTAWDFIDNPNDDTANNDHWDIDVNAIMNDGYPFLTWQFCSDTEAVSVGMTISFNEGGGDPGDGHAIDMLFSSITGSGNATVQQGDCPPSNVPCSNVLDLFWNISEGSSITGFETNLTFHYTDPDVSGCTESSGYLGIGKFNTSTNTWVWLGGTVNSGANTVTVDGVTSFSTFALFRRIFGDCNNDGYVDAADLQRLGDCWHAISAEEFLEGSDARFFNYNKNTDTGNQIIDAADLQVFGDCWHNGTP